MCLLFPVSKGEILTNLCAPFSDCNNPYAFSPSILTTPDFIHVTAGLPKTRSGKIMRRILRKIAANEPDNLGDTTTLADPSVVTSLVENRQNKG